MTRLLLTLGFVSAFSLATWLQPRFVAMQADPKAKDSALTILMGESSRLFAQHFLLKADAYFHSGAYPSIFDTVTNKEPVAIVSATHGAHDDADHEHDHDHHGEAHEESIYGKPHDWIEKLGHNFIPTTHSHLDRPGEAREIMPWLKLSAELDPQKITTYVTASYFLRQDPKHADEAEVFLRQGLHANPDSYEILLELGRFYYQNKKDPQRARNVWELAWAKWQKQKAADQKPDELSGSEILGELLKEARDRGDVQQQLKYLLLLKDVGTDKEAIEKQIEELKTQTNRSAR
jgi:hypothetical protein